MPVDIHFRTTSNTHDETSAGHKLSFRPAEGCDALSATANAPGFTPLIAIARHFGWDYGRLEAAAAACNDRGEVAVIADLTPRLFLVPATRGHGNTTFLIKDLLRATSKLAVEGLHFTHFGFLQGQFPEEEISDILRELLTPQQPLPLQRLVFDVDSRAEARLHGLLSPGRKPADARA